MPYQKTTWVDGGPPPLSAENLNHLEGQYDAVKSELQKADGTGDIKPAAVNVLIQDAGGNFASENVEDALQELAGHVQTGKNTIATAITEMGQSASGAETFDSLANKIRAISTDATAAVGDVLTGKTFYAGGAKKIGSMPDRGAVVITPGATNQTIPAGYHNGSGYVVGDPDLVAANIKAGVNIFGIAGSYYVPWLHDWSAYSPVYNWTPATTGTYITSGTWYTFAEISGEGWLTWCAIEQRYGSNFSTYGIPDIRITVDGTAYTLPGRTNTALDGDWIANQVVVPIHFNTSLKIEGKVNGTDRAYLACWYTALVKTGSPDPTKTTFLRAGQRRLAFLAGAGTVVSVTGSGYLVAILWGLASNVEGRGRVTVDGTLRMVEGPLVSAASNQNKTHMLFGPIRFTSSLLVEATYSSKQVTEVWYVLD